MSLFRAELWSDRCLVIAELGRVRPHRHGSLALLVGLNGEFLLELGNQTRCVREAVVPAGQLHALECGQTQVAVVYLFPTSEAFAGLSRDRRLLPSSDASWLADLRRPLLDVYEGAPANSLFQELSTTVARPQRRLDDRVRRAVEAFERSLMQSDEAHRPSLLEVGHSVGLSPSRLSHLFQSTLGVSPARYRRWVQMRSVSMRRAQGESLTQAALGAGFADSSHFAHAFVATFGIAPSTALGSSAVLRVHSE